VTAAAYFRRCRRELVQQGRVVTVIAVVGEDVVRGITRRDAARAVVAGTKSAHSRHDEAVGSAGGGELARAEISVDAESSGVRRDRAAYVPARAGRRVAH